ncbi:MAG TPA: hypothetical protein GX019_06640 [Firmicutes bacterium]|jgi:hypothetical protein|nr:hypothetical protein [Bacillota bacterium]
MILGIIVVVLCSLVLGSSAFAAEEETRSQKGVSDASELAPLPSKKTENTLARWALWGTIGLVAFAILVNAARRKIK